MSTWGHSVVLLTAAYRGRRRCDKCGELATHQCSYLVDGRHGGAVLTNRLRYCETHARGFAERNGLELPAAESAVAS